MLESQYRLAIGTIQRTRILIAAIRRQLNQ